MGGVLEDIVGGAAGGAATTGVVGYKYGSIASAASALGLGLPVAIIGGTIAGAYLFSRLYKQK